jgi:hypothetical protein
MALLRMELSTFPFDTEKVNPARYNFMEVHVQLFEHFLFGMISLKGYQSWLEMKRDKRLEALKNEIFSDINSLYTQVLISESTQP